jgi:OOP family OmpA-OmpF porin
MSTETSLPEPPAPDSSATALEELRALLLAPERQRIGRLQQRLDDERQRAADVGAVLPDAVVHSGAQGERLTAALMPSVEQAVQTSVQRHPQVLVNAIYPLMGAAIRRAVAAALASMVEGLNATLQRSLSLEGLKWRLESFRTGRPFGEVVLLRTLIYRVEQVLLIHEQTGILLQHVMTSDAHAQDADLVSGMMSAIRDFVHDSFRIEDGKSLDAMKAGDLLLRIEPGPHALLVGVIRGTPPVGLQQLFQATLERIHDTYGRELEAFSGDTATFDATRPDLEACLRTVTVEPAGTSGGRIGLLAAATVAVVAVLLFFAARSQLRWSDYLRRVAAEPGLVVMTQERGIRRFAVTGLRDPLAVDPASLQQQAGLTPAQVSSRWHPYQSVDRPLVARRAQALLRPPGSVNLELDGDVLRPKGEAPHRWVVDTRRVAPFVPGIAKYDDSALVDSDMAQAQSLREEIEQVHVHFDVGSAAVSRESAAIIDRVASLVTKLGGLAAAAGLQLSVEAIGHADATGTEATNLSLGGERARIVTARLAAAGAGAGIVIVGTGNGQPFLSIAGPAAENRIVRFAVRLKSDGTEPHP